MDQEKNQDRSQTTPIPITPALESTPLLPPNSSPNKWYTRMNCNPNSYTDSRLAPNAPDRLFSCSPMLSGLRTLHLPNLELRDATALSVQTTLDLSAPRRLGSSCEKLQEKIEGRERSRSLGDAKDRYNHVDKEAISAKITSLYIDKIGKRPSGLSLCFADDDETSNQKLEYGTTAQGHDTIDEAEMNQGDADITNLKQSQSCTISSLGIESPPLSPRTSPTKTIDNESYHKMDEAFDKDDTNQSPIISILYGLVNTSIILPVLMSFGSIIYHHDFFRPYLSTLMKLTVLSGAVHQITFSSVSSLPFAVGQVQDAGLVFLSAMSRDLVSRLQSRGEDAETILATVCVGLSLGTAILGLALIMVGKFRLASYMQMLPTCVVGGYLVSF